MLREGAEPILPSRDLDETRAFYRRLGFTIWFNGGAVNPNYEIVSRGEAVVHFFAEPDLDPFKNDAGCYWRVKDADALYEEFARLGLPREGIPRLNPPQDEPWWMREFNLVDPSGNLVRIGHNL